MKEEVIRDIVNSNGAITESTKEMRIVHSDDNIGDYVNIPSLAGLDNPEDGHFPITRDKEGIPHYKYQLTTLGLPI